MAKLYSGFYAYDITDNKQRRRALKVLRKVADCYQDSAFDCRLDKAGKQQLQQTLFELLVEGDLYLHIALPANTVCLQLGSGMQPLNEHSLIIS